VCPDTPEKPPRKVSWCKLTEDGPWNALRVFDPDGSLELEGELVTVTTRSGRTSEQHLGRLVVQVSATEAIYELAKEEEDDDLPAIPNGFYAVEVDSKLLLVKVVEFRSGRVHVFDADDRNREYPAKKVLEAIYEFGPGEAAIAYGRLRGHCARCDSPLENNLSVELGIGPVCGKHYFDRETWGNRKAAARAALRARGLEPNDSVRSEDFESVQHD